jgi:hypothetical protein
MAAHTDIDAVVAAIIDGHFDHDLPAIVEAINDRRRLIDTDQTRQALQRLRTGARVRIDNHVKPQYLQGLTGTIHQIDGTAVTVCLDTPVGRFTDGHISCSPRVLHPLTTTNT